ncbi:DoxX family protein [Hymenobacter terricola]|uniref:DoxX family protein n=1 Tax=Hymenobacter terricola TaxID=2819236 RepID=UPI001B3137CF|nr:DoxX family protein [Hymenobacter terricola]
MNPTTPPFAVAPIAVSPPARWPYWLVTGLLVVFIGLGAVLDVAQTPDAVAFIRHLGYPVYFLRLIGGWKLLAVAALLLPRRPHLKEWAYAGLFFDTTGAVYSHLASGDGPANWGPAFLGLVLTLGSYYLYRRRASAGATAVPTSCFF